MFWHSNYNYKRRHMSFSIDERPVVTPAIAYGKKGGKLNVKKNRYIWELITEHHILNFFHKKNLFFSAHSLMIFPVAFLIYSSRADFESPVIVDSSVKYFSRGILK